MKYLHRLFYPPAWPFAVKLSAAMLSVALIPISLTAYYNLLCQNSRSLMVVKAIAAIIALLLAWRIVRPIRALTKAAQALEQNNFTPRTLTKVSRTPDDMGHLVRVFLQMAQEVKAAREQRLKQEVKEVLLKELSNSDINWLIAKGRRAEIPAGTVLVQEGKAGDALHIVLDGTLAVTVSQGKVSDWEIARLASGEVVGESFFVGAQPTTTAIKAIETSLVLSITQQQLAAKLQQDVGFACRLYRAIAILLSDRLHRIISQLGYSPLIEGQPLRDVLFILGELNDSDIDWMIAKGSRQKVAANTVLIHEGGPVDALYLLLSGTMTVSVSENKRNPLTRAFAPREGRETSNREIARLSRGEILGETPFIDASLPSATVKTIEDSLILSIPRQQFAAKLQQDVGFASRFYRVIATLLSNRLQEMLSQHGYGKPVVSKNQRLDKAVEYDDELDFCVLDHMALAGTRFDWMLRRLKGI